MTKFSPLLHFSCIENTSRIKTAPSARVPGNMNRYTVHFQLGRELSLTSGPHKM